MNVVVCESKRELRRELAQDIETQGHKVTQARTLYDLETALAPNIDLAIIDSSLTDAPAMFVEGLKLTYPSLHVVLTSSKALSNEDMLALRNVIDDFIVKPFSSQRLQMALEKTLRTQTEHTKVSKSDDFLTLDVLPSIHSHPGMKKAAGLLNNVAGNDITVLISGESGVGKEMFARTCHLLSTRRNERFVGLNCASVPEQLLESELFGSEKGAYTGAVSRRIGKFELAQKGTLLLDEISEMALSLQSKLLRVIQEREVFRIGGNEAIPLDVRLISTTNRDLREWVKQGNFREDLFYRLNVITIYIPPLRERLEDVPILAQHFIERFNRDNPERNLNLTIGAVEQLCQYKWPGNVRELENILLRTAYLTKTNSIEKIYFDEIENNSGSDPVFTFTGTIEDMERKMIEHALELHDGNRVHAARQLGISVRTLRNKLKLYREEVRKKTREVKEIVTSFENKETSPTN